MPFICSRYKRFDFLRLHSTQFKGVIVTTTGQGKPGNYDFISRYFAPWNGISEDPVTGMKIELVLSRKLNDMFRLS